MKVSTTSVSTSPKIDIAARKRVIFLRILKEEFLRELHYLWEVANKRAVARDTLTKRMLSPIMDVSAAIPAISSVIKIFGKATEFAVNHYRDQKIGILASIQNELDLPRLEIILNNVAREALRRYESFIVDRLSDDPEVGVVPFAKVGARRMLERLFHEVRPYKGGARGAVMITESVLLAGLVEGRSGSFVEGFFNQALQLKRLKSGIITGGKPKTIDAEDVYARSGLRQWEMQEGKLVDILYVRDKAKHHEMPDWKKYTTEVLKGNIHLISDFGYVQFRQKKGHTQDPRSGYVLMPLEVIKKRYDFQPQDQKKLSSLLQTELKSSSHSVVAIDKVTLEKYLEWRKTTIHVEKSLVNYVREALNYPLVERVVCSSDLSHLSLQGADFNHTDFSGAILSGDLSGINFSDSYLVATQFKDVTRAHHLNLSRSHAEFLEAPGVDFQNSDWTQADVSFAKLTDCNLEGCQTLGVVWHEADLAGMRSDTLLLQEQKQQQESLQQEIKTQRQQFIDLTLLLQTQFAGLYTVQNELIKQLKQHNLEELSNQVHQLIQHQESRVLFESCCERELKEVRARLSQAADASALQRCQAELAAVQIEIKHLQNGAHWQSTLEFLQADSQRQLSSLSTAISSKIQELEKRLFDDSQSQWKEQSSRLQGLEKQLENVNSILQKRLSELERRVDVLQEWVDTATGLLATQEKEVKDTKGVTHELKAALKNVQAQLAEQQRQQAEQSTQIADLRRQMEAASNASTIKKLQKQIQEWMRPQEKDSLSEVSKPPEKLMTALQGWQVELNRQRELKSKMITKTPLLKSKIQPQIEQLVIQERQFIELQSQLQQNWAMHERMQAEVIERLQHSLEQIAADAQSRLQQLETDVTVLKSWAETTNQRLTTFETEESDTKKKLENLKNELSQWIQHQQKMQTEVTSLRKSLEEKSQNFQEIPSEWLERLRKIESKDSYPEVAVAVKKQIAAARLSYEEQRESIEENIREFGDSDGELTAMLELIASRVKELEAIQERFSTLHQAILEKLQNDTRQLRQELQQLTERVDKIDEKLIDIQGRVDQTQQKIDENDPHYTLGKRLLTLRKKILEDKYISDELDYYIAPNGKQQSDIDDKKAEPLQAWVEANFLKNEVRVLLLEAPGGAGKSTFNRYLMRQLWQDPAWKSFRPGDATPQALVPFFIPLGSEQVEPNHLFDYLRDLPELVEDFTDAEINVLKKEYRLLWIADGYDEIPGQRWLNLYDTNKLWQYDGRVKLLISRRDEDRTLTQEMESKYFRPSGDIFTKSCYRYFYIAPFNQAQRDSYIQKYLAQNSDSLWSDVSTYREHFAQIKDFERMISTPFLLRIIAEVLPVIIKGVEAEYAQRSGEQSSSSEKIEVTKKRLLDVFMDRWFNRQVDKARLKPSEEFLAEPADILGDAVVEEIKAIHSKDWEPQCLKRGYLLFCQQFANHLKEENRVSVIYPPIQSSRRGRLQTSSLVESLSFEVKKSDPWEKELLNPDDRDMERCRRGSPLRRVVYGHQGKGLSTPIEYGFIHSLLVSYFESTIEKIDGEQEKQKPHPSQLGRQPLPLGQMLLSSGSRSHAEVDKSQTIFTRK